MTSAEPKWAIVAIEGSKRWHFDSAETHAEAREKQVKWNHRAATDTGWSEMAFVLEKYSEPEVLWVHHSGSAWFPNPKPEMDGREITVKGTPENPYTHEESEDAVTKLQIENDRLREHLESFDVQREAR